MATWRRLILTGLLLVVMSLLVTVEEGPSPDGGEPVAAVQQDHDEPCSTGPSCAPFFIIASTRATSIVSTTSPADFWALAKLWHRPPHLSDDPPPPRSLA